MKYWLLLVTILIPWQANCQTVLPYKPTSRVSDIDAIFDPKTKDFISETLKEEYERNKISVYVVAMLKAERGREVAIANQLRDTWIKDPVGIVILFTRNSDKISISLTPKAYKDMAAGGRLELVASKIDEFNEEGPSRGMPKVIDLLLNRIRVDHRQMVVIPERDTPMALILGPICIILALLGVGMFKLYRYYEGQNVFTPCYTLKAEPIKPVLGSNFGGVNTAERKF